ncbi:hypothetical protein L9F63_027414, partial [Diploptera punctata]
GGKVPGRGTGLNWGYRILIQWAFHLSRVNFGAVVVSLDFYYYFLAVAKLLSPVPVIKCNEIIVLGFLLGAIVFDSYFRVTFLFELFEFCFFGISD